MRHVLILGGTSEARLVAARLAEHADLKITLSLAGRTKNPLPHAGALRSGGFGGADGLAQYLRHEKVELLIDATHPFAARISSNAARAAEASSVPLIALDRPAWIERAGDRWSKVESVEAAAEALGDAPRTVFLGIGRQHLAPFAKKPQHFYVVRSVEPVEQAMCLPRARYILGRGPFHEADERRLLAEAQVDLLVSRNSGGEAAYPKIAAARALGVPVFMIARPPAAARPRILFTEPEALVAHVVAFANERGA
ncbi:MAG: cobalt-precorrin-6A reductase [Stellaceae bacterium]